ncbi:magnesium protoporphyrin IX methyltransferase [Methylocapsa palsarum]|uniref:Magnesium protoporphyrin IX methyltransferase n=1 Tax=Methylocapsa palsarum TaxID=1612308 RepID=A0A1I4BC84_9HYPH|nr:magnesium protoporphyrin IX methyltransferase [Methylocapsa palsarum]SFK66442.1 magnesium-protoporphyrin O-methyltransferase [Methylocapsa palsarum]
MSNLSYLQRRSQIETYFDRTAVEAWARLTSDVPVGRIRATVRAGREDMRQTILNWLPSDLRGCRLLDAGCGTGALAVAAAERGADVVAADLSPQLIALARGRAPREFSCGRIEFRSGDMLDPSLGHFDHIVCMDSLIHYRVDDMVESLSKLAVRARRSIVFTFAPRTPMLSLMHGVGRLFPRADRAPAIEPVGEAALAKALDASPGLKSWKPARERRVVSGFYMSQALELRP